MFLQTFNLNALTILRRSAVEQKSRENSEATKISPSRKKRIISSNYGRILARAEIFSEKNFSTPSLTFGRYNIFSALILLLVTILRNIRFNFMMKFFNSVQCFFVILKVNSIYFEVLINFYPIFSATNYFTVNFKRGL